MYVICFGTKFKLSVDLTIIESGINFTIYLRYIVKSIPLSIIGSLQY